MPHCWNWTARLPTFQMVLLRSWPLTHALIVLALCAGPTGVLSAEPPTKDAVKKESARKLPVKGYIGIRMEMESGVEGVVAAAVVPGQPADQGGVKPDDVIVAFDGRPVASIDELISGISNTPPRTTIKLTVRRGGERIDLSVVTAMRPRFNPLLAQEHPPRVEAGTWELDGGELAGLPPQGANLVVTGSTSHINGTFEQTFTGLLDFEIDRRENHAALSVAGDVTLCGILYVNVKGFTLREGDEFAIIRNAKSVNGEFGKLMLPKLPGGLRWKIVYDDLENGVDHNRNGRHDVTLLVVKDGSGYDRP